MAAETYVSIGGLDWPLGTPEWLAYLKIARLGHSPGAMYAISGERKTADELGIMNPGRAMVKCVEHLLTPEEFSLNKWSEQILYEATNQDMLILAGCASAGKSFCTGLWAELWWAPCPKTTAIFMGSTSVAALRRRTFIGVIRYHNLLKKKIPGWPGTFSRSLCAIVNEDELREGITADDVSAGIQGIAFFGSSSPEVQATRIGGTHMSTIPGAADEGQGSVVVILDEMQALPGEAISRAVVNLSSGTDLCRLQGSGNFNTRSDMLGERAEPKTGWSSVDIERDKTWVTTRGGLLIRLDAHDSPAVTEPDGETKYPFLVGPKHIRRMQQEVKFNLQDPAYLSMARAWPKLEDASDIVFPITLQSKYQVREPPEWLRPNASRTRVLALDPAFTSGGDKAAVCGLEVGTFSDGTFGMGVFLEDVIPIDATSQTPVQYQLTRGLLKLMQEYHIPASHVGIDSSASQRIADIAIMESGERGFMEINFARKATDLYISSFSDTKACERYANLVTEIWFRVVEFASFGQLRGMGAAASRQFASRPIVEGKLPLRLLKKAEFKKIIGQSPDEADVLAMAVYVAMMTMGLVPGASAIPGSSLSDRFRRTTLPLSVDYIESDFSDPDDYS